MITEADVAAILGLSCDTTVVSLSCSLERVYDKLKSMFVHGKMSVRVLES